MQHFQLIQQNYTSDLETVANICITQSETIKFML